MTEPQPGVAARSIAPAPEDFEEMCEYCGAPACSCDRTRCASGETAEDARAERAGSPAFEQGMVAPLNDQRPGPYHPSDASQPHSGRPVVRHPSGGGVLVLCPAGHLVQSRGAGEWRGTYLQSRCADPAYTVNCHGSLPLPKPPSTDAADRLLAAHRTEIQSEGGRT